MRVANSTPMVDLDSRQNSLRVNRERMLDLPTPESPIRMRRRTCVRPCGEGTSRRRPSLVAPLGGCGCGCAAAAPGGCGRGLRGER